MKIRFDHNPTTGRTRAIAYDGDMKRSAFIILRTALKDDLLEVKKMLEEANGKKVE